MALSEWKLAAIVAVSTVFGGFTTEVVRLVLPDANTRSETAVQIVQLAIEVLQSDGFESAAATKEMRSWAVDTLNSTAKVKFSHEARNILISDGLPQVAVASPHINENTFGTGTVHSTADLGEN